MSENALGPGSTFSSPVYLKEIPKDDIAVDIGRASKRYRKAYIQEVRTATLTMADPTTAPFLLKGGGQMIGNINMKTHNLDNVGAINDIPVTDLVTTTTLGNYALTSALTGYVLTSTLANYALVSALSSYATIGAVNTALSNYTLSSTLSNYALSSALSSYATVASLADYETTAALSATLANYALTSSLSTYATTASLSSYATTASLSSYALTSALAAYETTAALASTLANYATAASLSSYALTSALASYALSSTLTGYLLIDGSRAMTGNLAMGANGVVSTGTSFLKQSYAWVKAAIGSQYTTAVTANVYTSVGYAAISNRLNNFTYTSGTKAITYTGTTTIPLHIQFTLQCSTSHPQSDNVFTKYGIIKNGATVICETQSTPPTDATTFHIYSVTMNGIDTACASTDYYQLMVTCEETTSISTYNPSIVLTSC